jgi:hypothetical protein
MRSQLLNSIKVYTPPTPPTPPTPSTYERPVSRLLILAVRRGSSGSRTLLDHSSGLAGQSQAEACPCRFCALLRCESSCLISKTRLHNKQLLLHSTPRLFCPHDMHLLSTHRLPPLFRPHNRKLSTQRAPLLFLVPQLQFPSCFTVPCLCSLPSYLSSLQFPLCGHSGAVRVLHLDQKAPQLAHNPQSKAPEGAPHLQPESPDGTRTCGQRPCDSRSADDADGCEGLRRLKRVR